MRKLGLHLLSLIALLATSCASFARMDSDELAAQPDRLPKHQIAPIGQNGKDFVLLENDDFGLKPGNTIHDVKQLRRRFSFRYANGLDQIGGGKGYWSYHRDNDGRAPLFIFTDNALTLRARIASEKLGDEGNGGFWNRGIVSAMLCSELLVKPGVYIEMRAKVPSGYGAWPAFWINPVEGWPPEMDVYEFFNWQYRPESKWMHIGTIGGNGNPQHSHVLWKHPRMDKDGNYTLPGEKSFADDFHVYALDWRKDNPIVYVDGEKVWEEHYEWVSNDGTPAKPATILVTNQVGISWSNPPGPYKGGAPDGMREDQFPMDYQVDYIRVWRRKAG